METMTLNAAPQWRFSSEQGKANYERALREYPAHRLRLVEDERAFPPERYVILYPKNGDPEVRRALGRALSALIADGTYAALYRKWFHEEPPPALRDAAYGK